MTSNSADQGLVRRPSGRPAKKGPFAFFSRWHPLGREIAVLLTLKVVALVVLANLFFSSDHRPTITDRAVQDRFLSSSPTAVPPRDQ